jgi:hypothetical protein
MASKQRKELIAELENKLHAKVLTFITGDRQGMETRIAPDIMPLISEHLSRMGETKTIALFLYTPGGDSIAGWGLVNLLRQYCKKLQVLVPFRALSCGTLIALGADEILMGKHGLLSPIDPSVGSPFNPPAPGSQQLGVTQLLPVSVEDMIGFLDLARKELGLKAGDSMVSVLNTLADKVHPLALGAVYRAREQNSSLATRLLLSHTKDKNKVKKIVKLLTQELPTHSYLIGRREATDDINLNIVNATAEVEKLIWSLYKDYEKWLKFTSPASPELDLGIDDRKNVRYERAVVESLTGKTLVQHVFVTDKILIKTSTTPQGMQTPIEQIMERIVYQGWVLTENGKVV